VVTNFDNMFTRFDIIVTSIGHTDQQTDGRTDRNPILISCISYYDDNSSSQQRSRASRPRICVAPLVGDAQVQASSV